MGWGVVQCDTIYEWVGVWYSVIPYMNGLGVWYSVIPYMNGFYNVIPYMNGLGGGTV